MHANEIQNIHPGLNKMSPQKATETAIYITDLLGELQVIAHIGGLAGLAEDLGSVLSQHSPNLDF